MEYRIVLTRMEFHALHGCYELERKVGNWAMRPRTTTCARRSTT